MPKLKQFSIHKKKKFPLRKEAEAWAKEQKSKHKQATDEVLKIDIDPVKSTGQWLAKLLRRV
jgi:hypothetical protein